jgi:hypothetical protein
MLERLLRILRQTPVRTPPRRRHPVRTHDAQPTPMPPASGPVLVSYAPNRDGRADPGEIVWTTVAFEDDPHQAKDRPVLIIGHRGGWLAGLMLTSKSPGVGGSRVFMNVGRGPWDRQQRTGHVRLDRLLDIDPALVRREGAALAPAVFAEVLQAARLHLPELR